MKDGAALFKGLRARLGSDLDPIYETYETPYTVYSVFKGQTKIGVVHGVNVPGKGGVIQVFLSTDPRPRVDQELLLPTPGEPRRAPASEQGVPGAVRRPDARRLLQARLLRRRRPGREGRQGRRHQTAGRSTRPASRTTRRRCAASEKT